MDTLLVSALLLPLATSLHTTSHRLVADFFTLKEVRKVAIYTCSKYDAFLLSKSLTSEGFWVTLGDHESTSVDALSSLPEVQFYKTGLFLDHDCQLGMGILQERLLNGSYYCLVWGKLPSEDLLDGLLLRMDSEVTWAIPGPTPSAAELLDLHKVNYSWPHIATPAGFWDAVGGLNYSLRQYKYTRRSLHGIVLRSAIVVTNIPIDNLETRLISTVNKHLDSLTKFNYALFLHLQDLFNYSMLLYPTKSWGYLTGVRTFDGMVGMLQHEQVELGVTSAIFKSIRHDVVDYTFHSWKFRPCFLFRHPTSAGVLTALFTPFTGRAWLGSAAMLALVVLVLRLSTWVEVRKEESQVESSWSAAVLDVAAAVSQQGTANESNWITWRIVMFVTLKLTVMMNSYYSASLVSSLLLPAPKTIRTLRDLIDSPLEVGIENISYNRDYFLRTTDPLGHELFRKKVFPPSRSEPAYYPLSVGVPRMKHEAFAFHAEVSTVYPLIEVEFDEQDKCALTEIQLFPPSVMSVPIQKRSPLKELIIYGQDESSGPFNSEDCHPGLSILVAIDDFKPKMRLGTERGLMNRQERLWRPEKPRCVDTEDVPVVELHALLPAFMLLAGGSLGAVLCLVAECCHFRKRCCNGTKKIHCDQVMWVAPAQVYGALHTKPLSSVLY